MNIQQQKNDKRHDLIYIEAFLAFILWGMTVYYSEETIHISFSSVIGLILYYMIFIELVRATIDFIFGDEHKFKVRYIYDMGIIFIIREMLVTMAAKHHHISDELIFLSISTGLLIVLFVLRIYDAKVFKYTDKCNSCSHEFTSK